MTVTNATFVEARMESNPLHTQKWKIADQLAQKSGQRRCVLSVTGNQYTGIGHQVWVKTGVEYEGEWKNDMRHGKGLQWVPDDSAPGEVRKQYEGDWRLSKMHGVGVFYYADGGYYEGEWRNNKRDGHGKMQYANGDYYDGEWSNDLRHGQGELTLADGNIYNGGWSKDMKEGKGSFFYKAKNQRYDGEWLNNTAKCGVLVDCPDTGNEKKQKLPQCYLADPETVLQEQHRILASNIQQEDIRSTTDSSV